MLTSRLYVMLHISRSPTTNDVIRVVIEASCSFSLLSFRYTAILIFPGLVMCMITGNRMEFNVADFA